MLLNEQGEQQLKQFSTFLKNHQTVLNNVISKCSIIATDECSNDEMRLGSILTCAEKNTLHLQPSSSIGIHFSYAAEQISTIDLIQSDNKCLNKTIAVFVELCMEVRKLCKEGNSLLVKCVFANEEVFEHIQNSENNLIDDPNESSKIDDISLSIDVINKFSSLLGVLLQAQQFIERCFIIVSEIIRQFTALFDVNSSGHINVDHSSLHFQTVFNYLAETIILIIKFDSIFQGSQLQNVWPQYMNAIKLAESNINTFNDVGGLTNALLKIDYLLSGHLFQSLIDSVSTYQTKYETSAQAFTQFSNQYHSYLKNTLNVVQKNNATAQTRNTSNSILSFSTFNAEDSASSDTLLALIEDIALDPSSLIVKMNAMCIVYHHLFGNLDQKLFASIIESNAKFPCVLLLDNVIWSPDLFLNEYGSTLLAKIRGVNEKISVVNVQRTQQQWLQTKCQRLSKDMPLHINQITTWIMCFRNEFGYSGRSKNQNQPLPNGDLKSSDLNRKVVLILQGIDFIEKFNNLIKTITNLHVHIECAMTKQSILSVCKLIELMKFVKLTMKTYSTEIFNTTLCLSQYQLYQTLHIITNAKKTFQSVSSSNSSVYDERTVDILSALELSQSVLIGSPNVKRILVARLALTMADPKQVFQMDQLSKICRLFVSIERLIQFSDILQNLSSESYMYCFQDAILPVYTRHIIDVNEASDCEKIQYLFESIADGYFDLILGSDMVEFKCPSKLTRDTSMIVNENLIAKLCGLIEMRLRLDVHTSLQLLQVENNDPFENTPANQAKRIPIEDVYRLLASKMIPLLRTHSKEPFSKYCYLSLRDHVSKYLSQMFYNLTTISMHDWRTYGQMRILAKQKFHLESVEDHLPTQTLEQGLDVLEIMRNIHLFVSNYLYNLNNQIFIEKNSKNKHLNTINIRHIANSLRTHGIGIINTTVNFTYQFLHKKFYIFSQFLYNEHIQSRLMKDLKLLREANSEKSEDQQMYSYERANSLNRYIRQLGVSKNGLSSLDLFRQLITHIGNAMGYIRMMRSGGIHACSTATLYLAIDDEKLEFHGPNSQLSGTAQSSVDNLENEVKHLHHNYAEATEYFRLLVDAFSTFFQNDKNPHMKLFYLIVPALIMNYVEYIVAAKETMNKKIKELGTCFTDDGFAMGLAYVLRLLKQNADFNSLHWFKAVRQKFSSELEQLAKAREENTDTNLKLQQTLALSEKRINVIQHEFDFFYCSLNSAKIFFQ
ncbi:WASH complex subunit 4 isoform X2 [Sitodiplosis mosellana]|uniref:WASH complex subunit 4 isoform X2 n=1 Tax=Sitodiplosis mosellana TaxID=263140 RepID=UPI0024451965|nr:WASH complex subunit 4 isoform X2 [Sitodiplosis mosellana]